MFPTIEYIIDLVSKALIKDIPVFVFVYYRENDDIKEFSREIPDLGFNDEEVMSIRNLNPEIAFFEISYL